MMWTIVLNTIAGTGFILALNTILPDLTLLIEIGQPLPYIVKSAVGSAGGTVALLVLMILPAICAGVGCTTTSSRCIWAFARDGAIPGSYLQSKVNTRLTVPLNAMLLSAAVQIVIGVISVGSTTAFNSFSSSGIIFLTVSYTVPIVVSFWGGRKHLKFGRFHFKKFGAFCKIVAIGIAVPSLDTGTHANEPSQSLVHPSRPSLLYAELPSRYCRIDELRQSCIFHICPDFRWLVLGVGLQKLPWPSCWCPEACGALRERGLSVISGLIIRLFKDL